MLNRVNDEYALSEHIFSTYITLRYGMAVLALLFPVLLWAVGEAVYDIELQSSMSHYYYAAWPPPGAIVEAYPMRVWFVGFLFAIGAFLYLYKGFTQRENIALNLAGLFAAGVALFPMDIECMDHCGWSLHGACAVLLFVCLAFVSIVCAPATLRYLPDVRALPPTAQGPYDQPVRTGTRAWFLRRYRILGAVMIASPAIALLLTFVFADNSRYTFFAEATGVWAFGLYWWVKSMEMKLSGAEKRGLRAELAPPPPPSLNPLKQEAPVRGEEDT